MQQGPLRSEEWTSAQGCGGATTGSTSPVRLSREHQHNSDRPAYVPAFLRGDPTAPLVDILHWHGSADLRTLAAANCLAVLGPGNYRLPAGEMVEVVVF